MLVGLPGPSARSDHEVWLALRNLAGQEWHLWVGLGVGWFGASLFPAQIQHAARTQAFCLFFSPGCPAATLHTFFDRGRKEAMARVGAGMASQLSVW